MRRSERQTVLVLLCLALATLALCVAVLLVAFIYYESRPRRITLPPWPSELDEKFPSDDH